MNFKDITYVYLLKCPFVGFIKEEWRPVVGYESYYEVSNLGRVRSLDRIITTRNNRKVRYVGSAKKLRLDKLGYVRVSLNKNGVKKLKLVHRLVAEAFISNSSNKTYVNHVNSERDDNRSTNLAWCTHAENMKHAGKHGKVLRGRSNMRAKKIVNCRGQEFDTVTEAAKAFNLKSMTSISNVLSGYKLTAGKYQDGSKVHWKEVTVKEDK